MAERISRQQVAEKAAILPEITVTPEVVVARVPTTVDRTFELPTALYAWTAGLYLAFMAVMALGFGNPNLVLPLAVMVVLIVAAFGVPAIWTRMAPGSRREPLGWSRFQYEGIRTAFGPSRARDATVQVLILPVLIFLWGLAAVMIAALV
jgi:hypothetical protein